VGMRAHKQTHDTMHAKYGSFSVKKLTKSADRVPTVVPMPTPE
jgi:hypothetical protein